MAPQLQGIVGNAKLGSWERSVVGGGGDLVYAVTVGTCHLSIPIEPAIPTETLNANCGVWGTVINMEKHACVVAVTLITWLDLKEP